jgi:hypothetical protein
MPMRCLWNRDGGEDAVMRLCGTVRLRDAVREDTTGPIAQRRR